MHKYNAKNADFASIVYDTLFNLLLYCDNFKVLAKRPQHPLVNIRIRFKSRPYVALISARSDFST